MQSRYAPCMLRKLRLQRRLKLRQQAPFYKLRGLSTPFADLGFIRRGLRREFLRWAKSIKMKFSAFLQTTSFINCKNPGDFYGLKSFVTNFHFHRSLV